MSMDDEYGVTQFDRERRAAKNRLGEISVGDITTREIEEGGQTLTTDDLRVLAIVVEEEQSLDPMLGLYIDGVSRNAISRVMDIARGSVAYRFEKLRNAGLVEEYTADDLPKKPTKGSWPKYAVATARGKEIVDELELIPILTRDRDLELVVDQLLSTVAEMHEEFLTVAGRQAAFMKEVHEKGDIGMDLIQYDFREFGLEGTSLADEPAFLQSRDQDLLLGEMDSAQRELLIQKLLDEDDDGDDTE